MATAFTSRYERGLPSTRISNCAPLGSFMPLTAPNPLPFAPDSFARRIFALKSKRNCPDLYGDPSRSTRCLEAHEAGVIENLFPVLILQMFIELHCRSAITQGTTKALLKMPLASGRPLFSRSRPERGMLKVRIETWNE